MKKTAMMVLALMVIGSSISFAGHGASCKYSPENREKLVEKKLSKMTKSFDLTDLQQEEVRKILDNKYTKKYEAKKRMKDEMKQISDDFKTKMNSILTAEQKPSFDKMVAKYEKKKNKKRKKFLIF